jgi:hypothetical protein
MPEKEETHDEILRLLRENAIVARENNEYLRKLYRNDMIEMWVKIIWYALLIGLPFAVYFYILEPYFHAFGANYEVFRQGMAEIPGLKGLEKLLPAFLNR